MNLLDNSFGANRVDLSCFDDLKATVPVILIITQAAESSADPSMDVGVVTEEAFLTGMIEVGTI